MMGAADSYWSDPEVHVGRDHLQRFWLANEDIRRAANAKITGSPDRWPIEWFLERFAERLPIGECAVIGCGTGSLERDLLAKGIVSRVTAVDAAEGVVEYARKAAAAANLERSIEYVVGDGVELLERSPRSFDAVFFHGALHHLAPVSDVLRLTRAALRDDGILYLDEYVGPSMHQWTWWRLAIPNLAYYAAVPRHLRRPRLIRAPRNPEDPSEMIDSAAILPEVRRQFHVLEERGYGGNILALVYPNLATERASAAGALPAAVRRLMAIERRLLGWQASHYAVVVATR